MFLGSLTRPVQRDKPRKLATPDELTEQAMMCFVPIVVTGDEP